MSFPQTVGIQTDAREMTAPDDRERSVECGRPAKPRKKRSRDVGLHPHLQSGTVGDWPLNVFDEEQAAAELPTLPAMAAADIHNLVFHLGGDVRIIPATVKGVDG